jgi:hypothetical protein
MMIFRPRTMLERHSPPDSYGDCWRTCLAMALDLDQLSIPHFGDDRIYPVADKAGRKAEAEWLASLGWARLAFPLYGGWDWEWVAAILRQQPADAVICVTGKSPRGEWNHDVIWRDGQLFDPFTGEAGDLAGPALDPDQPDAQWYWVNVITPALGTA